jgi:hypothetical protein
MKSEFHGDRFFMPRTKHFLGHRATGILLLIFSALEQRGPCDGDVRLNLNGFQAGSNLMQTLMQTWGNGGR